MRGLQVAWLLGLGQSLHRGGVDGAVRRARDRRGWAGPGGWLAVVSTQSYPPAAAQRPAGEPARPLEKLRERLFPSNIQIFTSPPARPQQLPRSTQTGPIDSHCRPPTSVLNFGSHPIAIAPQCRRQESTLVPLRIRPDRALGDGSYPPPAASMRICYAHASAQGRHARAKQWRRDRLWRH